MLVSFLNPRFRHQEPVFPQQLQTLRRSQAQTLKQSQATLRLGITLSCQPQNWLLVANPEVGNSEYIHYSELPTPLIIVYLV